jgi:bifunctional hydroxylase/dehydrase
MHAGKPLLLDFSDDGPMREAVTPWAGQILVATAKPVQLPADSLLHGVDAVLVRPDGYVAWVAPDRGWAQLRTALERWVGPA